METKELIEKYETIMISCDEQIKQGLPCELAVHLRDKDVCQLMLDFYKEYKNQQ